MHCTLLSPGGYFRVTRVSARACTHIHVRLSLSLLWRRKRERGGGGETSARGASRPSVIDLFSRGLGISGRRRALYTRLFHFATTNTRTYRQTSCALRSALHRIVYRDSSLESSREHIHKEICTQCRACGGELSRRSAEVANYLNYML